MALKVAAPDGVKVRRAMRAALLGGAGFWRSPDPNILSGGLGDGSKSLAAAGGPAATTSLPPPPLPPLLAASLHLTSCHPCRRSTLCRAARTSPPG